MSKRDKLLFCPLQVALLPFALLPSDSMAWNCNSNEIPGSGQCPCTPGAAVLAHSFGTLRLWQADTCTQQLVMATIGPAYAACRFARSGKKGRTELAYKLSPRGCAGRVHPQWMPQLQLHMAATGCQSVLLASR